MADEKDDDHDGYILPPGALWVPGLGDDSLPYLAAMFQLKDGEFPDDAIVVLGYIGEIDPDDPASSGSYWGMRTTGEGISSTHIGLLQMASHRLEHIANREDD